MKKLFSIIAAISFFAVSALSSPTSYIPRSEYPRMQFQRTEWQCLNGQWTYQFDFGQSGVEDRLYESEGFAQEITVPFCPESPLSGVGHKDFIPAMWYHRTLTVPQSWHGQRILLHFGGVDYRSQIYIDGRQVAEHYGGGASFTVDITRYVKAGDSHHLVVYVQDDVRSRLQPGGKQSRRLNSYECFYTRVTGIWSTVWMEPVAMKGLERVRITPDLDNQQFLFQPRFYEVEDGQQIEIIVRDGQRTVFSRRVAASNSSVVPAYINKVKTWSPDNPFLYDVEFVVTNAKGEVIDRVTSYAGMRKSEVRGGRFYLNNQPYYLRLVLDQGYYPDGQWTAPTDEQLRRDIELGLQAGFNGARLHQKVFDQRYFYWADKLGYLTWGESPSWEMDWTHPVAARNMLTEWEECVERDINEPCLVCWSPLNETWMPDNDQQRARLTNDLYYATRRLDPTRPVVTVSGGYHAGPTDIYAEHTYVQDPAALYEQLRMKDDGSVYTQFPDKSRGWQGECYMIDEFGGIRWVKQMQTQQEVAPEEQFWGYGKDPQSLEEYYDRLEKQVDVILSIPHIAGFCYTQIVDVELEKNGIYTYDRETKFDMERIRRIFSKDRETAKETITK